jgi:hypothetical protein
MQKAMATTNKAKKRKLLKQVNRAKQRTFIDLAESDLVVKAPNAKSAHWRRGHMRKQRYGEGNAKIKVIKISRTLVGKADGDDAPNTNYKVN